MFEQFNHNPTWNTPPPLKLIFLDQLKYSYIISITGIDLKSVLGSEVNFNELELTHSDGLASLHWLLCPIYALYTLTILAQSGKLNLLIVSHTAGGQLVKIYGVNFYNIDHTPLPVTQRASITNIWPFVLTFTVICKQ